MKMKLLSTSIMAALISFPVIADESVLDQQSDMAQMLLELDTDNNGFISRDEIIAGKQAEFDDADMNSDDYLSWDEFDALVNGKLADRNSTLFDVIDADDSNDISAEEFSAAFADRSADQVATVFTLASGGDSLMTIDELAAMNQPAPAKAMWDFAKKDSDADGQLSADEYIGEAARGGSKRTPEIMEETTVEESETQQNDGRMKRRPRR